jgi:hypothetical protein
VGGWMDYARYGLDGQSGIYTQDPWNNVLEIMSISLERVFAAGAAVAWENQELRDSEEGNVSSKL